MKITNKTHYTTQSLKTIAAAVVRLEFADEPELRRRVLDRLRITVEYTKDPHRGSSSGFAYLGSWALTVRIPRLNPNLLDFAYVICHEIGHAVRGETHSQMARNPRRYRTEGYTEYWALQGFEKYQLRVRATPKKRTREEKRGDRVAHCAAKVEEWKTKQKTATTKVKVWTRKLRQAEATLKKAATRSRDRSDVGR